MTTVDRGDEFLENGPPCSRTLFVGANRYADLTSSMVLVLQLLYDSFVIKPRFSLSGNAESHRDQHTRRLWKGSLASYTHRDEMDTLFAARPHGPYLEVLCSLHVERNPRPGGG